MGELQKTVVEIIDKEITQSLETLHGGKAFELRLIPVDSAKYPAYTGYFTNVAEALKAIKNCNLPTPYYHVYTTLNRIKDDVVKAQGNAINTLAKGRQATRNDDIAARIWLFIDFDVLKVKDGGTRPNDESSTDAEKAQAESLAKTVLKYLTAAGFPAPIVSDSGNGYHFLFRMTETANDTENNLIYAAFLKTLAAKWPKTEYNVEIDTGISNTSRICKVCGSKAVKGSNTAERPHRFAKMLRNPQEPATVSIDDLRRIVERERPQELQPKVYTPMLESFSSDSDALNYARRCLQDLRTLSEYKEFPSLVAAVRTAGLSFAECNAWCASDKEKYTGEASIRRLWNGWAASHTNVGIAGIIGICKNNGVDTGAIYHEMMQEKTEAERSTDIATIRKYCADNPKSLLEDAAALKDCWEKPIVLKAYAYEPAEIVEAARQARPKMAADSARLYFAVFTVMDEDIIKHRIGAAQFAVECLKCAGLPATDAIATHYKKKTGTDLPPLTAAEPVEEKSVDITQAKNAPAENAIVSAETDNESIESETQAAAEPAQADADAGTAAVTTPTQLLEKLNAAGIDTNDVVRYFCHVGLMDDLNGKVKEYDAAADKIRKHLDETLPAIQDFAQRYPKTDGESVVTLMQDRVFDLLVENGIFITDFIQYCNGALSIPCENIEDITDAKTLRSWLQAWDEIAEKLQTFVADRKTTLETFAGYHQKQFETETKIATFHSTGFTHVDEALQGGLTPGKLYAFCAVTSGGKTTFAEQMAESVARQGLPVLFVCLEMGENEMIARNLSRNTYRISREKGRGRELAFTDTEILMFDKLKETGNLSHDEIECVEQAKREFFGGYGRQYKFLQAFGTESKTKRADETVPGVNAYAITAEAQRIKKYYGTAPVVFVDYLQILAPIDTRADERIKANESITELKRLAVNLNTPVFAISAMNRDTTKDGNKMTLESFRESSGIEYGVDVALALQFRGEDITETEPRAILAKIQQWDKMTADEILAAKGEFPRKMMLRMMKNRAGSPTGYIEMEFFQDYYTFVDKRMYETESIRSNRLRLLPEYKGSTQKRFSTEPRGNEPKKSRRDILFERAQEERKATRARIDDAIATVRTKEPNDAPRISDIAIYAGMTEKAVKLFIANECTDAYTVTKAGRVTKTPAE